MNRYLPHRVNYVEKIDYIQTDASGEGISEIPTSFLSDWRLRSQIYMAKMGSNVNDSFAPAWKCWDLEEKEENSKCLPLSEYLTN